MVPEGEYSIPLGQADIKLAGSDCTVVTYGRMVNTCLTAAQELERMAYAWRSSTSAPWFPWIRRLF